MRIGSVVVSSQNRDTPIITLLRLKIQARDARHARIFAKWAKIQLIYSMRGKNQANTRNTRNTRGIPQIKSDAKTNILQKYTKSQNIASPKTKTRQPKPI